MHELVTVQLGPLSNNLGSHYWQLQHHNLPSTPPTTTHPPYINPHILFHTSQPYSRLPSQTPRLQLLDIPQTLSQLPQTPSHETSHPAPPRTTTTWSSGPTQIYRQDPLPPSSTTKIWSSRWNTPLHPRSLTPLPVSTTTTDDVDSVSVSWDDIYENGLRYFVEDCDSIGGVQFVGDLYVGTKGRRLDKLSGEYLMYLRDELGRRKDFVFVGCLCMEEEDGGSVGLELFGGKGRRKDEMIAKSFAEIVVEAEAMVVPVEGWMDSGIAVRNVAMALDGFSMPARLVEGGLTLGDMMQRLGGDDSSNVANVAGLRVGNDIDDDGQKKKGLVSVSPWIACGQTPRVEFRCGRGVAKSEELGWAKRIDENSTLYRLDLWGKVKIPNSWSSGEDETLRKDAIRVESGCYIESCGEDGGLLRKAARCLRASGSKYEDQAEALGGKASD